MLKAELSVKEELGNIEFRGNIEEALVDTTYIVRDLYNHFCEVSPMGGAFFKKAFQEIILDDDSPVWATDRPHRDGIQKVEIRLPNCFGKDGD